MFDRRNFLGAASLATAAFMAAPGLALAAARTERRFVFIIQRGAADGLDIVRPAGDPGFAALRGPLIDQGPPGLKLDGTFSLHPALAGLGDLYGKGEALFAHAVATPYRDRSHFDGQNVLETGGTAPYALKDGWLNRLLTLLPRAGGEAIAIGPIVPMALRGTTAVGSYAPSDLPQPSDDLLSRVSRLYDADKQLHPLWSAATEARTLAAGADGAARGAGLGRLAATFLSKPTGPRIAMIETNGWDTHNGQVGRLAGQLRQLDALVAALREGLGDSWSQTVVLVATEFGRTAAVNGTGGTDHGTGSAALLAGGAVKGGRVVADWPGLRASSLYEQRDLKPTANLDALIAGVVAETFVLDPEIVRRSLLGAGAGTSGLTGLIQA